MDELDRLDCATVIDARAVSTSSLSEIEAYLLALQADEKSRLRRHRMAVVVSGEPPSDLGFFIVSARNCGLQVQSFECIESASAWAGQ